MKQSGLVLLMLVVFACSVSAEYYDFGGATVTLVAQENPASRFIEGVGPESLSPAYGLHLEAEVLFNCTIEFIGSDFPSLPDLLLTRVLSGDAVNDIWMLNSLHYFVLLPAGVYYPLNEVLPEEYFENLPGLPRGAADYMSFRGERYGFGVVSSLGGLNVIAYSRDLLDELGLPDPQDLYLAGEWTWGALEEIAAEATRPSGDGRVFYGLSGLVDQSYFHGFAFTNARASWVQEEDGRLVFSANRVPFLEALNQVRDWVDRGIASPRVDRNPDQRRTMQGEIAMMLTNLGRFYGQAVRDQELGQRRYGLVPLPMGPRADEYLISGQFLQSRVLPVTAEHPEGLVQLADFLYPPDEYYLEVEDLISVYAQDRRTAQILWEMHDGATAWTAPMTHPQAGMGATRDRIIDVLLGRRTPAAAMDEVAQEQQALLDELWGP